MKNQNKIGSLRMELETAINLGSVAYFIFLILIIASTLFSPMSNYSASAFIAKGILALLLIIAALLIQWKERLSSRLWQKNILYALLLFFGFMVYLALTLTYSANFRFGLLKLANFLVSFLPLWFGYTILFLSLTKKRLTLFIFQITILLSAATIIIVTLHPFAYMGSYSLSFNEWSHVILGRFVGIAFLVFILIYINKIISVKSSLAFIVASLLLLLNFITGLRGGIIAALIVTLMHLGYALSKKYYKRISLLLTAILFASSVFFLVPGISNTAESRVVNLLQYSVGKQNADGPIAAREELYKISSQIIKNNIFWGVGFGGFRNIEFGEAAYANKYPHNLFLECWTELGIPGLIICSILLLIILKKTYQINIQFTILTLYPIILAMFSKDLPDQTLLALPLALLALPGENKKLIKEMFSL